MTLFVKFEDGKITEGPVGDSVAPQGFVEYREVINLPPDADNVTVTVALVDGVCVKTVTGQTSYAKQRQNAYPSLGDQMDMLWHAMDDNIIPRVEPFYTDILNVKEQYPKPVVA
jgi:hypothetical protein